jgi:hypothetical protein
MRAHDRHYQAQLGSVQSVQKDRKLNMKKNKNLTRSMKMTKHNHKNATEKMETDGRMKMSPNDSEKMHRKDKNIQYYNGQRINSSASPCVVRFEAFLRAVMIDPVKGSRG